MPIQFRKTSIRSRKRTLGLAAFGLILDAIVSHPRVDVPAMVNVAMMSRFAVAPVMASLGSLSWTTSTGSSNTVATTPVMSADHVTRMCARAHGSAS
ncbi:hypothetical protein AB8A31_04825 [Tardiphaga sp. 804_B3_N1_9]|jgi:hypothetical protein|uniref:hypothetical protein n=1 Tax=Tardiphaga TaxID=1395974 RepID=UPI0015869790|nr:hypothetical protein [Tardiphaga robiniae]NUU39543.1 hypothetical protein [Tardiphaga robiniae]